jgi:hypothetical protein
MLRWSISHIEIDPVSNQCIAVIAEDTKQRIEAEYIVSNTDNLPSFVGNEYNLYLINKKISVV